MRQQRGHGARLHRGVDLLLALCLIEADPVRGYRITALGAAALTMFEGTASQAFD